MIMIRNRHNHRQGRAWGQIESTQGVGMGGGIPLPNVRKKNQDMN